MTPHPPPPHFKFSHYYPLTPSTTPAPTEILIIPQPAFYITNLKVHWFLGRNIRHFQSLAIGFLKGFSSWNLKNRASLNQTFKIISKPQNLSHGQQTATIWKLSAQNFQTYFRSKYMQLIVDSDSDCRNNPWILHLMDLMHSLGYISIKFFQVLIPIHHLYLSILRTVL